MGRKLNLEYRAMRAEHRFIPRCPICHQRTQRGTHDGCYRDAEHGERIGTTYEGVRRLRKLRRVGEDKPLMVDNQLRDLGYVSISTEDLGEFFGISQWTTITEAGLKALKV